MDTEIFISHCPKDRLIAETLCGLLTERGYVCMTSSGFTAREKADTGSHIKALSTMKVFIIVYSLNSASSGRVARQTELALNKAGTAVLPYRIDNAPITARYARFLMTPRRIDAYPSNNDWRFDQLYTAVSWHINGRAPSGGNIAMPFAAGNYARYVAQFPRARKNSGTVIFAAVCAAVFAGGAVATLGYQFIREKLQERGSVNKTVAAATPVEKSEEITGGVTMDCRLRFLDMMYDGEYCGEVGANGLPNRRGKFSGTCTNGGVTYNLEYTGSFVDGMLYGKGECKYDFGDGKSYEFSGIFDNGTVRGKGVCEISYNESDSLTKDKLEGIWAGPIDASDYTETKYFANGDVKVFSGELTDSRWTGEGSVHITYAAGDMKEQILEGTWTNGYLEGEATDEVVYRNGNGYKYTGGYTNGTWNGKGKKVLTYPSGDIKEKIYEGTYVNGEMEGKITRTIKYTDGDVSVYKGESANSDAEGKGVQTYTYASGKVKESVFKGEWKDGNKHGEGVYTKYYKESTKRSASVTVELEGVWTNGELSGNVVSTNTLVGGTIKVYKGNYMNGNWHGAGELTIKFDEEDGDGEEEMVISGIWQDGKLSGKVTMKEYFKNGDVSEYEGEYSDNCKNGKGKTVCNNEKTGEKWVEEGTYKDDKLTDGTKTWYGKDGSVTKTETVREEDETEE